MGSQTQYRYDEQTLWGESAQGKQQVYMAEWEGPADDTHRQFVGDWQDKKQQCAIQAPGAGQPRWPASGARGEYVCGSDSKWQDSKLNKGSFDNTKLTDKTWIKQGLKPFVQGTRICTGNTHSSREHDNSDDSPPLPAPPL